MYSSKVCGNIHKLYSHLVFVNKSPALQLQKDELTKRLCIKSHRYVKGETFRITRDKNGLDAPDLS